MTPKQNSTPDYKPGGFSHVFSTPVMLSASSTTMTQQDEFLLVLMKLRLNLLVEDLAYRFDVAKSTSVISSPFGMILWLLD